MTGVFTSPDGVLAWTFSVIFRIVGAAAIAPTAAAPTAVFCRKLRLDIFDLFSSAIRFPSVRVRERTSRTISGRPDRLKGYFDVCNIACYKSPVVNRPAPSCRADQNSRIGDTNPIHWAHSLPHFAPSVSR